MIALILRTSGIAKVTALLAALCVLAIPIASPAQVTIGIGFTAGYAPPPLPYYTQPALVTPGYIWEPGYWAWGPYGYYWVPGTWVAPPQVGYYWTPGYWGYNGANYIWNNGYWGPAVGYYGGINYGFGYFGTGYVGGAWNNGVFGYNTAVTNVNTTVIHNVYIDRTVIVRRTVDRNVSYNGGPGGVVARPTAAERVVRAQRVEATPEQVQHARAAAQDHNLLSSANHGRPMDAAVSRPISDAHQLPHYQPVKESDRKPPRR